MGLDITAYATLFPIDRKGVDPTQLQMFLDHGHWLEISDHEIKSTEKDFPGRTGDLKPGIYGFGDRFTFRAGSYSGYGVFRDWLATLTGKWTSARDCWECGHLGDPFYELISFFDNEGVIGAQTAAKLSGDFQKYYGRAIGRDAGKMEWVPSYRRWKIACEIASDGGVIDFH